MAGDFAAFARAHGVMIDAYWRVERVMTCPTRGHPKKKNGRWWWDGKRGWVCAHDEGGELIWFDDPDAKPWTERDKAEWLREREARRSRQQRKWAAAAQQATEILKTCHASSHGYLRLKGVGDTIALVTPDDALFVPMRSHQTNELQGAQLIRWLPEDRVWEKKMIYGMRAEGAVFRVGRPAAPETILCEGYATGLSIEAAIRLTKLDIAVIVCFSDHNLVKVAEHMSGRTYVFADNDVSGAGERAAVATGLPWVMSDVVGEDANDVLTERGVYKLAEMVMELRRMT